MHKTTLTLIIFFLLTGTSFAAHRYISLAPSTTEILYALGLEDEIVGVSSYCNYPPAASKKQQIGDFSHPNIEKIYSLKPDYIFCTGLEQAPVVTELQRLKFKLYVADPSTLDELFTTIIDIGMLTNRTKEARDLVSAMQEDIEMIQIKLKTIPEGKRVKVFIEIWHEPLMTAGKGSCVDEVISLAGGINIAHDVIRPFCNYSAEKVVELNPGCIIMTYMDKEQPLRLVESRYGWANIDAVKKSKVFNDINPDLLLRPGPRITQGIMAVFKKLYPDE